MRTAEYYRIPPQKDRNWEVELYDESKDTWFKLSPDELDRYADLSGSTSSSHFSPSVDEESKLTWDAYVAGSGPYNNFLIKMRPEPDAVITTITMPQVLYPRLDIGWAQSLRSLLTVHSNAFGTTHTKADYHAIVQSCVRDRVFVPRPNCTNFRDTEFPLESRNVPFWMFMNAAFLSNVCGFLWLQIAGIDRRVMQEKIIPFIYGSNHGAALADYNAIPVDARMNIYHTVAFLGCAMRWHPDDDVRNDLERRFAERGIGVHTLRAALVHFVKRNLDDVMEEIPNGRIMLGKRLEDVFRTGRFHSAEDSRAVYDRWPRSDEGILPVALAAGVAENVGSLDDYRIEELYNREGNRYPWNHMLPIRPGNDVSIHEGTVIDSFFYAGMLRMMTDPNDNRDWPDFWPVLKCKGSREAVEYVIVRPVIEHNMLAVIMGRGGDDLGNTLWGQTELSCYDDSFHGTWGMSYKYHSRAIIFNNKNMIRLFDVAYDGYNGGKDDRPVDWAAEAPGENRPFNQAVGDMSMPYNGPSLMVMKFNVNVNSREYSRNWPSPIVFHDKLEIDPPRMGIDPESLYVISDPSWRVFNRPEYREQYRAYLNRMPDFSYFHQTRKLPGYSSVDFESTQNALAFQGSMRILRQGATPTEVYGSGHHGPDMIGIAAVRAGKGMRPVSTPPQAMRLVA